MLAREAFQEMLFPLSEKELHYREHPEDSLIYFKISGMRAKRLL